VKESLLSYFKYLLTVIGSWLSIGAHHQVQMVANYMRVGRWMNDHDFRFPQRVMDREGVFATVANRIRNAKVLYLEFGVYKGESMRYWSGALRHPESQLHGFDSFEGLPEDFDVDGPYRLGTFDVAGTIPNIQDERVRFFKGWFDQVLPSYKVPDHDVLVLMMDADLYSSTIYVLREMKPHIKEGTFVFFDEMSRPDHEPKAFDEFMRESGLRFKPICADRGLNRVFFECVG
jgi:O-methyltransferase